MKTPIPSAAPGDHVSWAAMTAKPRPAERRRTGTRKQAPNVSATAPSLERVSRPRLVDSISDQLRDLILSGQLTPGTKLLQIDLSERLGVSRTPLREALRVLERDGLIQTANGNRTVEVVDPDPIDLLELYQIREVLDGLAAALCAEQGLSPAQGKRLDSLARKMERLSMPDEADSYIKTHAEFHAQLFEASSNTRLQDMGTLYVNMSSQKSLLRFVVAHEPERKEELEATIDELVGADDTDHRELLDAIAEGRTKDAEAIARLHIERSITLVEAFLPPG
jgi:GntR family transcriptional regulator, vanillate catabolism transcriptional regulator